MKKTILHVNTSDRTKSVVSLEIDGKKETLSIDAPLGTGTAVLTIIESLLYKNSLKMSDITNIQFVTGPGSYTGLRVGATIVNTLSWFLKIPINGEALGTLATPRYSEHSS